MDFELSELGHAYRKAKADLFYSSRSCRESLIMYESNLLDNLINLQSSLAKNIYPIFQNDSWTLIPKAIKYDYHSDVISSDPEHIWNEIIENDNNVHVEFRVMEKLPIDFHVFSTLWINKIGHKFDAKLSNSSRGNRLRRTKSGELNKHSLGSTQPYLHPYCKWRDDAINIMAQALKNNGSIVALTADASSYYHRIDPKFMVNKNFLEKIDVNLTDQELIFHNLFIQSLCDWSDKTPLKSGLPVGLISSSIIANLALFELDQIIEQEIAPLYYGRYVDDIILVMNNGSQFKNSYEILSWVINHSRNALSWSKNNTELSYTRSYLETSEIVFKKGKNKVFLLSGQEGNTILEAIRAEIQSRSSEWRSLPSLPEDSFELESQLLSAIQHNGDFVDNLRKADKISIRRAQFALKLRDIEAISRLLDNEVSQKQRHAFINASIKHICTLPAFFDYFNYIPRILRLIVSHGEFDDLNLILKALDKVINKLKNSKIKINSSEEYNPNILDYFTDNLKIIVKESIESSFPTYLNKNSKKSWESLSDNKYVVYEFETFNDTQKKNHFYLKYDLGHYPFKFNLLPLYLTGLRRHPLPKKEFSKLKLEIAERLLDSSIIEGCKIASKIFNVPLNPSLSNGILFPTRPVGMHELYLVHPDAFSSKGSQQISKILLSQRGYMPDRKLPGYSQGNSKNPIEVSFNENKDKIKIAITSWLTKEESWVACLTKNNDPDNQRLLRINKLINDILKSSSKPDYLILPELSIPTNWYLSIASKLRGKRISFISGVEYIHSSKNKIHNQAWASLLHDALGYNEIMIIKQEKQRPAIYEERDIYSIAEKTLSQQLRAWTKPPIINHGGFYFSILICSELTNIEYRNSLRGKIDALFIPEWNKDTESFNSLVESAALDMHAYLIQCNNRKYGDSRIRGPFKDSWLRDIIRVKGGIDDYFVIGEISIKELRRFQSHYRSPTDPFKPVPDGFEIAFNRKTIPSS